MEQMHVVKACHNTNAAEGMGNGVDCDALSGHASLSNVYSFLFFLKLRKYPTKLRFFCPGPER